MNHTPTPAIPIIRWTVTASVLIVLVAALLNRATPVRAQDAPDVSGADGASPEAASPAQTPELDGEPPLYYRHRSEPEALPKEWDGSSYVVHEWGTFTTVQGSDGSVLDGLRHEEWDLPDFVYDLRDFAGITGVSPKMETPVIYFYSPDEQKAVVRVKFPRGAVTQWYPAAHSVNHLGMVVNGAPSNPTGARIDELANGHVSWGDWNELTVLAPDAEVEFPEVDDDDPWRFSREVDANPLRVCSLNEARLAAVRLGQPLTSIVLQHEKSLFYRGLGDFPLPLTGTVEREGTDALGGYTVSLTLRNTTPDEPLAHIFVIRVWGDRAGFHYVKSLDDSGSLRFETLSIPLEPLAESTEKLIKQLAVHLTETGLYSKEALAMARTWQHGYFQEEGLRVLYVLPREFIDRELPLTVDFGRANEQRQQRVPDSIVRTFVGRTELLSPGQEREMTATVVALATGDSDARTAAAKRLKAWGRFAIPYLQRARQLATTDDVRAEIDRQLEAMALRR